MEEKSRVVISKTRRPDTPLREFKFNAEDILPGALNRFRNKAWEVYTQLPIPTVAEEAWRRTDIRLMPADTFRLPEDGVEKKFPAVPGRVTKSFGQTSLGGTVLLVPRGSRARLDPSASKKGVIFSPLRTAEREHASLVSSLIGTIIRPEDGKFTALTSAFSRNGIVLYVPKNVVLEEPLNCLYWATGKGLAHLSHTIIWLEDGASATYIHETTSPDEEGDSMHASNLEIRIGKNASLQFVELQNLNQQTWNFTHTRARIEQGGKLDWIFGGIGSRMTKSFTEMDLAGEGASGRMSGFYFSNGNQHLDLDTQQNHLAPHTTSDLLYKGALTGNSRVVWQGMIYVSPAAQKTDGYQANRNLVLSKGARADSIPGLEILADDVRCTHGATVGRLEDEPMFYLKSRGIPQNEGERLIVEGFFDPIMQRIPIRKVRGQFQRVIQQKSRW